MDTSVWIAHLREGQPVLVDLLRDGLVLAHPLNLHRRASLLADLALLPAAAPASDSEVMVLIEGRRLWGRGLGWVDAHLLASAQISHSRLWTLDDCLGTVASELGLK